MRRLLGTLSLIFHALFPDKDGPAGEAAGEGMVCTPRAFGGGVNRFLDRRGEFRLLIPDCLSIAAPFVLFRLKREGYSGCSVKGTREGLYVQGRR